MYQVLFSLKFFGVIIVLILFVLRIKIVSNVIRYPS